MEKITQVKRRIFLGSAMTEYVKTSDILFLLHSRPII